MLKFNNINLLDTSTFTTQMAATGAQSAMSTDMSASINGPAIFLGNIINYSVQAVFTGSPNGTFKLQASNDGATILQTSGTVLNWTDVTSSSVSVSAAGDVMFNIVNAGYAWVRLVYTRTSGSGTITSAKITSKGI